MNDQVKRAAHLEATVSTMTADIHERQMRRATLFVRALDLACVELNARAPTASVEEWRSLLMVRASRQARPATCRKEMAPSELVAIANDLREELTKEAKQRQQAAGREHGRGQDSLCSGEHKLSRGGTREVVGKTLGLTGSTYGRAKHIVKVAEDPKAPPEVLQATQAAQTEVES